VEQKLCPLRSRGEIARARRVLDVGCGPGTNTAAFDHTAYVGIDVNPAYIQTARQRFGREFLVADVTTFPWPAGAEFDFIFLNSLLHHVESNDARELLRRLATLVVSGGYLHIIDLVLPEHRWSIPWVLAKLDRGDYPRPLAELRALVSMSFEIVDFAPFPLRAGGIDLWHCVYFKARPKVFAES
jgi:SAM-dependent methyltransferase